MKRRVLALGLSSIVWLGCSGEGDEQGRTGVARSWMLEKDASGAFVDAEHDLGGYPNPHGLADLEVSLMRDGRLCGSHGTDTWCGGPMQGIPYTVLVGRDGDQTCYRVKDLFGRQAEKYCSSTIAHSASSEGTEAANCLGEDPNLQGAKLFTSVANQYFERIGLDLALSEPKAGPSAPEGDEVEVGDPCAGVEEYLEDEFKDDIGDGEDDLFGANARKECLEEGHCRIGQLVTRAIAESCGSIPTGCNVPAASRGVVAQGGLAVVALCDDDGKSVDGLPFAKGTPPTLEGGDANRVTQCVGSPIVLDLAGDGLSLRGTDSGVRFPVVGTLPMATGWLAGSDDALLAIDLDGDGRITSGAELFGEATNGWARDGFAALRRYDDNGDSVIDARDVVYDKLLAWTDDGDGVSEAGETRTLRDLGVATLPLSPTRIDHSDEHGNLLGLAATGRAADGRSIPVIDVWFRMGSRGDRFEH